MTPAQLPPSSLAAMQTQRLAHPQVLWENLGPDDAPLDPERLFCCRQPYENDGLYAPETRVEWADRYGGAGLGGAAGSGRCSTLDGRQTKGVGVTPLVSPRADELHSSGTQMLFEAATEALFSAVYQLCLPFGAVPIQALFVTGGHFTRTFGDEAAAPFVRALTIRPFVPRPAHFMRNLHFPNGNKGAGAVAPNLSFDAWRTGQAMGYLAVNLKESLALDADEHDEIALLDLGLRELARRLAWQCAAGFAKRLPHGTFSCSNIALNGAYLDFGVSNFVPAYRRLCWAQGQDTWTESLWPIRTLVSLRQQLEKYRPGIASSSLASREALVETFTHHLQDRLGIEMVKMAGLTEDMAVACPSKLRNAWLDVMHRIWTCGADERFVTYTGLMIDGHPTPAPRRRGRYDLNRTMAEAANHIDAARMGQALTPLLTDDKMRVDFVAAASSVRAWLCNLVGDRAASLNAYLSLQARRKNVCIKALQRGRSEGIDILPTFRQLEVAKDYASIGAAINRALSEARFILADMHPALPGNDGLAQALSLPEASQDSIRYV